MGMDSLSFSECPFVNAFVQECVVGLEVGVKGGKGHL